MRCRDLVTQKPHTCHESDRVERAARMMRDYEIGFLPVLDNHRRVTGVLTDRDLATRVVADRRPPETQVQEVMTTGELVSCDPDDDVVIAASRMARAMKSRILVLDAYGHCVGVISLSDIGRLDDSLLATRVLSAVARRESTAQPETR